MATVVVTGATGAIGSATVAALEKRRAQVIALSRPALDLSSMASVRAAADLADLALSPAHAGTSGWFFKGGKRIDPPKSSLDEAAQSALWKRSAELVELETGF